MHPPPPLSDHSLRRDFLDRLDKMVPVRMHYEAMLEHMYRKILKPGQVVYDVGCHLGRHAQPFLALVGPTGQVFGFEPIPKMAAHLRSLAQAHPNFTLHEMAMSNTNGQTEFVFAAGTPEESGLRQRQFNRPDLAQPQVIQVTVRRLDDLAVEQNMPSPDFVKIDIEGAEMDFLDGAATVLDKARPILSVEYGSSGFAAYGRAANDLWDFAQGRQFKVYDIFGYLIGSAQDWADVCDKGSWDWFLVPAEKADGIEAAWAI